MDMRLYRLHRLAHESRNLRSTRVTTMGITMDTTMDMITDMIMSMITHTIMDTITDTTMDTSTLMVMRMTISISGISATYLR